MEKFDEKQYLKLIQDYYNLSDNHNYIEQDEFKKKYITNTVYEEYFQDKKLKKNEVIERIQKSFNKIKEYDLESIYLLGVSENKTEYMLPLIEKEIFLLAEKNNAVLTVNEGKNLEKNQKFSFQGSFTYNVIKQI